MPVLSELIRTWREDAGITQETLSDAIGVSRTLIASWEQGRGAPRTAQVWPLVSALGLSTRERDELLKAAHEDHIQRRSFLARTCGGRR